MGSDVTEVYDPPLSGKNYFIIDLSIKMVLELIYKVIKFDLSCVALEL